MNIVIENFDNYYEEWARDDEKIIDFLLRMKCLPKEANCHKCRKLIPINKKKLSFRCGKKSCKNFYKSARTGTFFENSKLTVFQIVKFIVWFCEMSSPRQQKMMRNLKLTSKTVVDWVSFCREVCCIHLEKNSVALGGPGKIIEIDEAKFSKRKYNGGRRIEGQWVFGGIERGTKNIFYETVETRDKETLLEIIKRRILPGTTVISNMWKAYDCLSHEGFNHFSINHSINFVSSTDPSVHTQNIKRSWRDARGGMPRFGRKKSHLAGYLAEHLFKTKYSGNNTIEAFFKAIAEVYPV